MGIALNLKRVGIITRDDQKQALFEIATHKLGQAGIDTELLSLPYESVTEFDAADAATHANHCDLLLVLGGDGTVLRTVYRYPDHPILPINSGTVGFLTSGDHTELAALLDKLLQGSYHIDQRMLLQCEVNDMTAHVLNEVVVRSALHMIQVGVSIDGMPIRTIRGDGVIVSTPTGSTGYLLSGGGPIVMPSTQCFVLDGLHEYNFSSRPVILPSTACLTLQILNISSRDHANLYTDGRDYCLLKEGDILTLRKSNHIAKLVVFDSNIFFHNLSTRLAW